MHLRLIVAALLAWAGAGPASAQAFKPFPRADITVAQWTAYFDEVRAAPGLTAQDIDDQKLMLFVEPRSATLYAFTKPGHPAHPAWITRKLEERDGQVFVAQIGYFAGAEPPFAQLFRAYQALNEKMKDDVQRQRLAAGRGAAASEPQR